MPPLLPAARGPLSRDLFAHLRGDRPLATPTLRGVDAFDDDDLHLALWSAYELHHHGFEGVDDGAEWDIEVLRFRAVLEHAFESALRAEHHEGSLPRHPEVALRVIGSWAGPSLSSGMAAWGTKDHLREFAIHRSAYQLKEADSHTWALPRLRGRGRSAMIEIQADEYGQGVPQAAHAELFAAAMAELGLHREFGFYIDQLPGSTLATDNLVNLFGLNRRLRGALVGHLALFEMTSVAPMSNYLSVARRLGGLRAFERFYEAHVEADAHHGTIALEQMVRGVVGDEPHLAPDIIFGAAALSRVEARFARHVLRSWDRGESSLRDAGASVVDLRPPTIGGTAPITSVPA